MSILAGAITGGVLGAVSVAYRGQRLGTASGLLMGSPSVTSPFEQDRWDYVSTQQHRGGEIKVRTFTLTFNNDTLVRTEGDFFAQDAQQLLNDTKRYKVNYPVDETRGDKSESPSDAGAGDKPSDK
jgi:outer membrane protein assembly factor BamE